VAAMIWAAEPDLDADDVESILFRTMRTSPDRTVGRRVIHAYGAVQDALPPLVKITAPRPDATLPAGPPQRLRAVVYSDDHGQAAVIWRRGSTVIGNGSFSSAVLPPGTYDLTATARFTDGTTVSDRVRVTVVNHAPTVHITSPRNADGSTPTFGQSEPITFRGTSSDETGQLPDSRVTWHLDGAAASFATGHNPTLSTGAAPGEHAITFRGCDAFGACSSETVRINIHADEPNRPPTVRITNPANHAFLDVNGSDANGWYHQLTLRSEVSDPDGDPVSLRWLDNGVQIATGRNPTVRLRGQCEHVFHRLTLIGTDSAGNSRQDVVEVDVVIVC
jgi:serine protease